MYESHPEPESALAELGVGDSMLAAGPAPVRQEAVDPNDPSTWRNSPRNAPCPCGSGKKFKHCHGKLV
jgi:preprotein translocase subunit SecA